MIRILQLNASTEKRLLRARHFRDIEAERVAAKIIADVRKRGDSALFAWTKKLDGLNLTTKSVYLPGRGAALLRPSLSRRSESTSTRVSPACRGVPNPPQLGFPPTFSVP
jgi:histidinol dehydrogenase